MSIHTHNTTLSGKINIQKEELWIEGCEQPPPIYVYKYYYPKKMFIDIDIV
ncbi:hypothetical protein [Pasteuria penetrans]|uniref:hypothetical protein n=1 Tax=Pasteuria penetrans TaxID=86005 RepID=UPI00165C3E78|nr:hypothetical protein [Pasteuria penetrans]